MIADAGLGDDRPRCPRRQLGQSGGFEIAIARLLEPFEIGAMVGMAERVALAPPHAMMDRKPPSRLDPKPRPFRRFDSCCPFTGIGYQSRRAILNGPFRTIRLRERAATPCFPPIHSLIARQSDANPLLARQRTVIRMQIAWVGTCAVRTL